MNIDKKKIKEFITKNLKWIILFICLIGFLAIAEDVFNKEIMSGDIIGYKLVSTFLISNFATPIAKFITNFGGAIFLITLTIVLLVLIKNKKIVTDFNEKIANNTNITGNKESDIINNIYDLYGCHFEWTIASFDTNFRVGKGGYYSYNDSIAYRSVNGPNYTGDIGSSRATLYIK